jgi:hypothetical protein
MPRLANGRKETCGGGLRKLLAEPACRAGLGAIQRYGRADAARRGGGSNQERAFAAGRRTAWDRIQGMVNAPRRPTDAELDRMVRSIVIEQENTGPQRYSGRLTIQFDADAVQSFAEGAEVRAATLPSGTASESPISNTPATPVLASVEATARYASLNEWLEIRRRVVAAGARLDVMAITIDRAHLNIGLRIPIGLAPETFGQHGLQLTRGSGAQNDQWRLGLAGRS